MRKVLFLLLIAAVSSVSLGCSDLYLIEEFHEQTADGWESAGAGCMLIDDQLSGSGLGIADGDSLETSDFSVSTRIEDNQASVVVRSQGEELLRETFKEGFLESGDKREYQVVTVNGGTYRLRWWGSETCDYPSQE